MKVTRTVPNAFGFSRSKKGVASWMRSRYGLAVSRLLHLPKFKNPKPNNEKRATRSGAGRPIASRSGVAGAYFFCFRFASIEISVWGTASRRSFEIAFPVTLQTP